MKKIFLIVTILYSLQAFSQTVSTQEKTGRLYFAMNNIVAPVANEAQGKLIVLDEKLTEKDTGAFTDYRNGRKYKWRKYGDRIWMTENVNYETESGSWCYNHHVTSCDSFGRLYNWEWSQLACPDGWHLPARYEWQDLLDYFWDRHQSVMYNAFVEDGYSKFKVILSGWRHPDETFNNFGYAAYFWTRDQHESGNSWYTYFTKWNEELGMNFYYVKEFGFSVRCVQDK
jgi:uncharacterized protein (TIGR02145 family)